MKILSLLICLTIFTTPSVRAQRSFKMITEVFDQQTNNWVDTASVTQYWVNSSGQLDSVVEALHASPQINKFYNWVPVSSQVVPFSMHGLFSAFAQLQTAGQLPTLGMRYLRTVDGEQLQEIDSAMLKGEHLQRYKTTNVNSTGQPESWVTDFYEYTNEGEVREFRQEQRSPWGEEKVVQIFRKARYYDDRGRVMSSTTTSMSMGLDHPFDSISYSYDADGSLSTSLYFSLTDGIASLKSKSEYSNWKTFEHEYTPFITNSLAVGNDSYANLTEHYWSDDMQRFNVILNVEKEFDQANRVTRSTLTDTLGNATRYVTSYYSNGDLLEARLVINLSNDSGIARRRYENIYRGDGMLLSSIFSAFGEPVRRYTFVYPTSFVNGDTFIHPTIANSGRDLILGDGEHTVTLTNLLGKQVLSLRTEHQQLHLADLPSGLYFISIDGGKPRKHLIP